MTEDSPPEDGRDERVLISVVIPIHNRYEYTRRCLKSIEDVSHGEGEILVVDNGSTDGSGEQIKREFPWARVLRSEVNLGYTGGCNLGIRESRGEFIFLLNNDTRIVDRELLAILVGELQADPRLAAVGPRIVDYDNPTKIVFDGQDDPYGHLAITGVAVVIRRAALEAVGLFDESFFAYYEDRDLFARFQKAGWSLRHIPSVRLAHKGSVTAVAGSGFYYRWHNRNLIVFLRRHSTLRHLILRVFPAWSRTSAWAVQSLVRRRDWEALRLWMAGYWEGVRAALADQPPRGPFLGGGP